MQPATRFALERYAMVSVSRTLPIHTPLLLVTCLLAFVASAPCALATVPSPPQLPAAGGVFHDPNDAPGTRIMRVTDASIGGDAINSYSYYPSFNANSTRLLVDVTNGVPLLYDFNPNAFSLGAARPLFASVPAGSGSLSWEDAIWSSTNPDILYCHDIVGPRLWAYNVATNTYTLAKDFSSLLPANSYLAQISKSHDDSTFGFTIRNASDYSMIGYGAWTAQTPNAMLVNNPLPLQGLDEVQVDKTGRYLVVKTDAQGAGAVSAKIIDMQTQVTTDLVDNAPDYAPGHSDNGQGIVVGADNWLNRVTIRNLATPHALSTLVSFGNDWSQGFHISMLADDESKALLSFFTANNLPQSLPYNDQIAFVATDGSGTVTPLAYHYSVYHSYYDSPRADISLDGRFVAFTSNWGDSGRLDVFVLAIPDLPIDLPGDYNHDGIVDAADYSVWRDSLGQSGVGLAADGNHNNIIDSGDYSVWTTHFGQVAGSGAHAHSTIPEPTDWILLIAGMLTTSCCRLSRGANVTSSSFLLRCLPRECGEAN
jgi:hypothetical protein